MKMLDEYIRRSLEAYFHIQPNGDVITPVVSVKAPRSELSKFVLHHGLTRQELLVLLIALMPHINPGFFEECVQKLLPTSGEFPELGGIRGKNFRGFLPTG